jgi:hypothetical protein
MAVERLQSCDNTVALSEELGVHRRLLYKWRGGKITYVHHLLRSTQCQASLHAARAGKGRRDRSVSDYWPVS